MTHLQFFGLAVGGALLAWLLLRSAQRANDHKSERTRREIKQYVHDYQTKERK